MDLRLRKGNFVNTIYTDGCSYTAGCDEFNTGGLAKALDEPKTAAQTAKSNVNILQDFITNLPHILEAKTSVLIYWSHSERDFQVWDEESSRCISGKGLTAGLDLDWRDLGDGGQGQPGNNTYNKFLAMHAKTITYMLAVQEICEANNIDYRFITTDPYVEFERISQHKKINIEKVFNWPLPGIQSRLDLDNKDLFSAWWSVRSLTLQFARAFGSLNNKNYVHPDSKHMTDEGAALMGTMVKEWWDNPEKDLQWYYDNVLNGPAKSYFVDEQAHWKNLLDSGDVSTHWVERNIKELKDILLAPATFIYEE